jgi:hypothetical protein
VSQDGANADSGRLDPLTPASTVFSLAPFDDGHFIAGAPLINTVVKFEIGLTDGEAVIDRGPMFAGRKVATGNLGLGSATVPDVVAVGQLSLTVVGDGTMAPVTCAMKAPNESQDPVISLEALTIANVDTSTPHDEIVVGHRSLVGDLPRVLILDAGSIQNGTNCSEATALVMPDGNAPVSVQVAQLDGATTPLDMVTGSIRANDGVVRVFMNPTYAPGSTPESMEIPLGDDENASRVRGSRIRIANIAGGNENEIIVGDPAATMENVSRSGNVQIFRPGACGAGGGEVRGPVCLLRTLYDPTPASNDQFGRALAIGSFRSSKGERTILAVGARARIWVYYRVEAEGTDPRDGH